jgi:Rrf2 family protein
VESRRGASGGFRLAQQPSVISVGDVIRAVDGPLVFVRDARPSDLDEGATDASLLRLWVALRASVRNVLDVTTLSQLASGELPPPIEQLLRQPSSWLNAPVNFHVGSE